MSDSTTYFMRTVQALAQSADIQLGLFPDFVCKADELALDFDECRGAYLARHDKDLTREQRESIDDLDRFLEQLSREETRDFWTDDAIRTDPRWLQARNLAKRVIDAFGWSGDPPPKDRATYVPTLR